MLNRFILLTLIALSATISTAINAQQDLFKGGHAKYFFLLGTFPDDSLYRDYIDSPSTDHNADLRLKFGWQKDTVSVAADYQLIGQYGDSITLSNSLPGQILTTSRVPSDDHRLFDLTHILSEDDDSILAHRLDRLYIDITGAKAVARIGRQAVSWGNGLIYTPMDFFNPFDPAAVDKEYKTGDDMLYAQYLTDSGDDLQAVWVIRRDLDGDVSKDVNSIAAKYHGFAGDYEFDILIAEHFDDSIFGLSGIANIGGAVWRGDITLTLSEDSMTETDSVASAVTSLSYSWVSWGHNVSGILEYFYNGFGIDDGDYSPAVLAANPALVERILRGELFTLGRHYIAASAMIEMTPLWLLTPNIFLNASDGSLLAQLVSSYDLKQDVQLLAALGLPAGADGTEYGGIDSSIPGKPLSFGASLFVQLAMYF